VYEVLVVFFVLLIVEGILLKISGISAYEVLIGEKYSSYKKHYKEKIIRKFIKQFGENLEYDSIRGISSSKYNEGQFEHYDRYYSEDLIRGTLDSGHKITMAEVYTADKTGKMVSIIFGGIFIMMDLDKTIPVNMDLRVDKIIPTYIDLKKDKWKLDKKENKVEMDYGEFEKNYNVYSDNKIVTMQLLTADVMQMFLDMKKQNKIIPEISLRFNKIYIRFRTGKNIFEPDMYRKATNYDTLKYYYDTIGFSINLIEKITKNIEKTEI